MAIKSDLQNAIQDSGGIVRSGSDMQLPGVGTVAVSQVPAQDSCEWCYDQIQACMDTYNGLLQRDGEHISAIAHAWEEIDQAVKKSY